MIDNVELKNNLTSLEKSGNVAIMISDGNGGYVESEDTIYPTDMLYNAEKSGCIDLNGNKISNALTYSEDEYTIRSGETCYCYLYFDVDKSFVIFSETDNSLRFYNNDDYDNISVGDTYNNILVSNIYKAVQTNEYIYDYEKNEYTTPWYNYAEQINKVIVEDVLKPKSMDIWFIDFKNVTYMNLNNLDTSNVKSMLNAFGSCAKNSTTLEIYGLEKFNTENVESLQGTFMHFGYSLEKFDIDLTNWNTEKVTNMYGTFIATGYSATEFSLGDLTNWNTSNVLDMNNMFLHTGNTATEFYVGNLGNWDVSKVTNMLMMFQGCGYQSKKVNLGDLSKWNTENVEDMSQMFAYLGSVATELNMGNISNWNTKNVTTMKLMFINVGLYANWSMNLSNWDVSKVTDYTDFSNNSNLIQPTWVN